MPGDDGDDDEAGDDCSVDDDEDDDKKLRFEPMLRTSTTLPKNAGVKTVFASFGALGTFFPLSTVFQLSQTG